MYALRPILLKILAGAAASSLVVGCSLTDSTDSSESNLDSPDSLPVNIAAGGMVLYEAQVRTANACRPDTGTADQIAACNAKVAAPPIYRAQGMDCAIKDDLAKVKLGTLDDMNEDTADYHTGITVRYVHDKVGANTLWLMPLFPNNDQWNLPDGCDNLGSPYAVRDYFHASGIISRACIQKGKDEYSDTPCWANDQLDATVQNAHSKGMRVMLDVAFNHFGHNYLPYDVANVALDGDAIGGWGDFSAFWNFDQTYDQSLVHPSLVDSPDTLNALVANSPKDKGLLDGLKNKCPTLQGDALVRSFHAYRLALPNERSQFACTGFLEGQDPGFYLGADKVDPSTHLGDNFTNSWTDVKFIFHHEENTAHQWEFVREREYLFRVLNYWVSRGVDGFRFDHTTDFDGGMGSNEWKYLLTKVDYYAKKRGQAQPVYLAEEFSEQMEMNKVVDIMTEGYVGDMCGRNGVTKDTAHVESVLENMNRFDGRVFTMTALETHDEKRLTDGTGFDPWTGAGFWGIGATTRSTPMMLMGQELGAGWGLGFKRSDIIRARFPGSQDYFSGADQLLPYYQTLINGRFAQSNRALLSPNHYYLRTRDNGGVDARIFAMAKWSDDLNVVFVLHNLWSVDVSQVYAINDDLAGKLELQGGTRYRFVDIISGSQQGDCKSGDDLKNSGLYVSMSAATRAQWLRLEQCN